MKLHFGLGTDETWASLQKAVFKGTECGAFIEQIESKDGVGETFGIAVGSIVEGCDAQTETHHLYYPFKASALDYALDLVEEEAHNIWQVSNGDDVPDDHPGFCADFLTY